MSCDRLEDECIQSIVRELPCKVSKLSPTSCDPNIWHHVIHLIQLCVSVQVVQVKGEMCYHFTVSRKDLFVPVQEPLVEIFKKLHSMLHVRFVPYCMTEKPSVSFL